MHSASSRMGRRAGASGQNAGLIGPQTGGRSSELPKGITISIGDAYDAKPYVPKLASIAQSGP